MKRPPHQRGRRGREAAAILPFAAALALSPAAIKFIDEAIGADWAQAVYLFAVWIGVIVIAGALSGARRWRGDGDA